MENNSEMRVTKRNGNLEIISFDKILNRIKNLGQEAGVQINYSSLAMKVIDQLYDKIETKKIDELAAEQCAALSTLHYDYSVLSSRIIISNHQKNTSDSFYDVMMRLYNFRDVNGNHRPLIAENIWKFVENCRDDLDNLIVHNRDYLIDYFGFKTLERAYLFRLNNIVVERIQHMWLRVAVGIHADLNNIAKSIELIRETYDLMSLKYFTHATPTLFNSGTPRPQLSSCYLIGMEDDSLDGIYNTLHDCAMISKWAGGVGLHIHNVRAKGTHIQGTNGTSNGIVPMLRVFNNTARYVDQCLDPDTIVYTKRGPTMIKNIVIGDKVMTDDGNMYPIRKVLNYDYFGDMYKLSVKHTLYPLIATDMHPLWVIKNNTFYQTKFTSVINDLEKKLIAPEFIEIKNITKNDFVGFPIPKYEKDISHYTEDDCRMYGILLGDGNISSLNNLAYISLNKETKQNTITFIEDYLSKLNTHITYSYSGDKNVRLTWTRNNMFKFTYEMLYDDNRVKHIVNNMLHLSKSKILNIIKGVLETDGKVSEHQIVLEMTSHSIVEGIRYMLLRLGILTSGSTRNRIGQEHVTKYGKTIINKKLSYILIIPKKQIICDLFKEKNLTPSEVFTFFEYDGFLFSIVNKNEYTKDHCGRVIDIEVDNENHHNFLTHNGLVKNGGGKRNGSFAIYLEPWHPDIEDFLEMKKNHGDEELKARDLFYALWIGDLFMERVRDNSKWCYFCPHECPGLSDVYGEEFNTLYQKYESEGKARKVVNARDLWFKILDAQMETGTPYILYKDAVNKKSNQKNLGTIKSSNLCVAPETRILTDNGHTEIQTLVGQKVNVWNGEEWSEVTIEKTGVNQKVIQVTIEIESENKNMIPPRRILRCTPYHKFYINNLNENGEKTIKEIEAKDLNIDMELIGYNEPTNLKNNYNYLPSYKSAKVKCIGDYGEYCDTYCFTEPKRHMGIFNGIITGQCTEITEYSDANETAVCNLASIALPSFVNVETKQFDYDKLHSVTKVVTNNLDRVIDVNFYPTEKTRRSNMRHRPIGLGVQGLADTFVLMDIPFHSEEAKEVNKLIFETIYHASLERSNEIAIDRKTDYLLDESNLTLTEEESKNLKLEYKGAYSSFTNSPISNGIFQFDMWGVTPSNRYDWNKLRKSIIENGLRNSLLVAPMPTASTSQILGFNECFEPFTSNLYSRRTLAGEFVVVNKYLMKELINLGYWNEKIKNNIIANKGSIQHLTILPEHIRNKYKIVWEIPMKHVIDMAADRGAFICQSQSLNLWVEDPTYNTLTSMHFYSWKKGLKTGIYYLRRKAKHQAQQFTIEPEAKENVQEEDEICEMCSA